jgi:hypothetical protein
MELTHRLSLAALAALAMASAAGCAGGGPRIQPLTAPAESTEPTPPPPPAPPPQVQLTPPPEPVHLTPAPRAARRVAVLVTERLEASAEARRDPESEAILAEALLAARGDLEIEVVKRGTYEEILNRDFDALVHQGLSDNAQVLSNLLKAGVDYFAMAEVGASQMVREIGRGRTLSDRSHVHAGVQVVRTDDGTVLAAANADSQEASYRDARTRALTEAAQRIIENLRNADRNPALRAVTITVDGLSKFEEAERILGKLKETEGVVWSRDLRFSASAPGTAGGVARFEIAFRGSPEELRAKVAKIDAGTRLEVTRIEGNRWNYHAAPGSAAEAPARPRADPQQESPKAEK